MRYLFGLNIVLSCLLFVAWLGYVALMGPADPVSEQVGWIIAVTAVLLTIQGAVRWRRSRRVRVSA